MHTFSLRPVPTKTPFGETLPTRVVWTSLSIENGYVGLQGKILKPFRRPPTSDTIPFSNIANARVADGFLCFAVLQGGLIHHEIVFRLKNKDDASLILALLPSTSVTEYTPQVQAEITEMKGLHEALLANARVPYITYTIAALCILWQLFIITQGVGILDPSPEDLLRFGGNFAPATLLGETWRLLSCGFVHGGLLHIGINLYALFAVAPLVERLYGHARYTLLYIGALLSGSILSLAMNSDVVSIGASGALFGLFAAILAYIFRCRKSLPESVRLDLFKSNISCILVNLLYGLKAGIDNWAHLGGAIGGLLIGLLAATPLPDPKAAPKPSYPGRFFALLILLPLLGIPAYHIAASRHHYLFVQQQYGEILASFIENHPEFITEDGALQPSEDNLLNFLNTSIDELYTPQLNLLQNTPQSAFSRSESTHRPLLQLLDYTQARYEAASAHRDAILQNDPSRAPSLRTLYDHANSLEQSLFEK